MEPNDSNGHISTTTASLDTYEYQHTVGISWHVSNLSNYPNPQGLASFAIFIFGYIWAIPHFEDTTYYDILGGVPKIGLPPNHPNSVHGFSNYKPPSYWGTAMTIFKLPHQTQKRLRGPLILDYF